MCNLYRMTSNVEAIRRLFGATEGGQANLPTFDEIYPDAQVPVVRNAHGGGRELMLMRWGFPPPVGGTRPVTNVRNLASPFWRASLANPERRCLVPVTAFAEWTAEPDPVTRRKRKVWFTLADEAELPFAFAGLWRPAPALHDGDRRGRPVEAEPRMAFLTTLANSVVAAVHPKAMPVILARDDYATWLSGDVQAAAALATPYSSAAMRLCD